MKEITLLAFIASILLTSFSSIPIENLNFRPPGTAEIVDNFFMDVGEIRNADWREYMFDLRDNHGEDSDLYNNALYDASVWLKDGMDMTPYVETYFNHPAYNDYPIVGISHLQAKNYCEWRTKAVKKMLKREEVSGPLDFQYRLPTRTEWELVSQAGYDKKQNRMIEKQSNKYGKDARFYNMRYSQSEDPNTLTAPTHTYFPNKYGVYNIFGNVAEMVAEQGIAMGGSYRHLYQDIIPSNKEINYKGPQDWLGFRCVCEIIEE